MAYPKVADTYLKVQDMDRAVRFYEALLGVKAKYRYKDRWTSITDRLALYNPSSDVQNEVPMTDHDRPVRIGNNVVIVFMSDDIDREYERVQALGITGLTDIVEVNLVAPYRFFQCFDTEGNLIELGHMG